MGLFFPSTEHYWRQYSDSVRVPGQLRTGEAVFFRREEKKGELKHRPKQRGALHVEEADKASQSGGSCTKAVIVVLNWHFERPDSRLRYQESQYLYNKFLENRITTQKNMLYKLRKTI